MGLHFLKRAKGNHNCLLHCEQTIFWCSRRCASPARPVPSRTARPVGVKGDAPTARRGYRPSIDVVPSGHEADDRPARVCRSLEARQRCGVVPRPCNEDATGNASVREVACVRSHCAASIGPPGCRHSGLWRNIDGRRRARRCGQSAPSFGVAPSSTLGASCSSARTLSNGGRTSSLERAKGLKVEQGLRCPSSSLGVAPKESLHPNLVRRASTRQRGTSSVRSTPPSRDTQTHTHCPVGARSATVNNAQISGSPRSSGVDSIRVARDVPFWTTHRASA